MDFNITQSCEDNFTNEYVNKQIGWGESFQRISNLSDSCIKKIYPSSEQYIQFTVNNYDIEENDKYINNANGINKKIYLFGDSYIFNIKGFFGYNFKETKYGFKPNQIYMPAFENEIRNYKPDIVVLIVYSQNFELIKNWYIK